MGILICLKFISLSPLFCFLLICGFPAEISVYKHFALYSDYRYVDSLYLKTYFFPETKYKIFVIKMRLRQKKKTLIQFLSVGFFLKPTFDLLLFLYIIMPKSIRLEMSEKFITSVFIVVFAQIGAVNLFEIQAAKWFSFLLFEIQFRRRTVFFFFFAQFIHYRVEASTGTMKIGEQKSLTVLWINRYIAETGICNIVVGATMEHVATETRYKSKIMTGTLYNRHLWSFLYFASWLMSSVIVVSVCFCRSLFVVSITDMLYFHLVNIKTRWILKSGLAYLQSRPSAQHWVPFIYCKLVISMIAEDWNKDQYDTKRSSILFC